MHYESSELIGKETESLTDSKLILETESQTDSELILDRKDHGEYLV